MAYKVVRSIESDLDLDLIFEHLVESYQSFGEPLEDAFNRASKRLDAIEDELDALVLKPHRGTLLPSILKGLRSITINQVVIYFTVNETVKEVRIFAFFFGAQDHRRRMLSRLIGTSSG